jgi:hypothetical protein
LLLIALSTVFNTDQGFAGSRTSSPSSTCCWTSLASLSVFYSSSMISFGCLDVSWADGLIFRRSWNLLRCQVFHSEATIGTNIYGCDTINSILSIRTYINTSIILLPTILLSLPSATLVRTFQSQCKMTISRAHLALTRLVGITFPGLLTCSTIYFPGPVLISTKNISGSCPSFNLKAFQTEQLYKLWPYVESVIICPFVYNPIYSSSNWSCSKVHLNLNVRVYGSFMRPFMLMKSISSSWCLTSGYAA